MFRMSRAVQIAAVTFTFVFAPAIVYLSPALDARRPCERAADWAATHTMSLPRNAFELAAFPESVKRTIFSQLSPETKAAIWKEQLVNFETNRSLTAQQRLSFDRFISHITPS